MIGSAFVRSGLWFSDPDDEHSFFERYVLRHRFAIQALAIFCGVLNYIYFLTDRYIDVKNSDSSHAVRGLVLIVILICAGSLSIKSIQKHIEIIIIFAFCCASIGLYFIDWFLYGGLEYSGSGFVLIWIASITLFPIRAIFYLIFIPVLLTSVFGTVLISSYFGPIELVNTVSVVAAVLMGSVAIVRREFVARAEWKLSLEVEGGRRRIDELLHSMLPSEIVDRIQSGETAIADAYGEVSIVFADLVGFTEMSRRISAAHLVEILNKFFSEFDSRAEKHGLDRIKTIGDAYMAVGGLNRSRTSSDHAKSAAEFAIDIQEVVSDLCKEVGYPINMRVGLHIGPVVAGVIGTKRPAFDCWGETVNIASRLEGVARPGSIIISESTYWRLKSDFKISILDDVDLKGIGPTKIYLLEQPLY